MQFIKQASWNNQEMTKYTEYQISFVQKLGKYQSQNVIQCYTWFTSNKTRNLIITNRSQGNGMGKRKHCYNKHNCARFHHCQSSCSSQKLFHLTDILHVLWHTQHMHRQARWTAYPWNWDYFRSLKMLPLSTADITDYQWSEITLSLPLHPCLYYKWSMKNIQGYQLKV